MEANHISSDKLERRQKKTRNAIHTALLELMNQKPLDKITISEVAALADINRKTFYNHYDSILDVKRELDQQYIDVLFQLLEDREDHILTEGLDYYIDLMIDAISKEPKRARLLFESGELYYLTEQIQKLLRPYLAVLANSNGISETMLRFILEYVASGIIAVLSSWVKNEIPATAEEVKNILKQMVPTEVGIRNFPTAPFPPTLPSHRNTGYGNRNPLQDGRSS